MNEGWPPWALCEIVYCLYRLIDSLIDLFFHKTQLLLHHLNEFFSTGRTHYISGQVLRSHSIVSSSRSSAPIQAMRWKSRWIGQWRTTWSTICSSAPHSQRGPYPLAQAGAEKSDNGAEFKPDTRCPWQAIVGGWAPMVRMKVQILVGSSNHSAFHRWSVQSDALLLLLSDELMSCCEASTKMCLDLKCCAFPPGVQIRAERSRCTGSMALLGAY